MAWRLRHVRGDARRFAEFLPDAQGVVERGHSPVAGLLILSISLAVGGLIAWAAITKVEQVVRADGQVEPAGQVKLVNHPDGGRIAEVHVVEGQSVSLGDPLVTFDAELVRAELAGVTGRWQARAAEAARLEAEASGGELELASALAVETPHLLREQSALLASRREAHASNMSALEQTVERRAREVEMLAAELAGQRKGHALLGEEIDAVRELAEKGLYPRLRLAASERQLSDAAGNVNESRARLLAAEAAHAEAESRRDGYEREWRASILAELARARAERDQLSEMRNRLLATLRNLVVRAPVDGIVQDLAVTTAGQSVGSNQPLMKLVPTGQGLVIEARVANRDIGYLRVGQPAKIKVLAYDFLRYGMLSGEVERIAADATVDRTSGAFTYEIAIRTHGDTLPAGGHTVSVVPGMAVEVDLLAGERTILSYLTDRIFRMQEAAFREG
jgi:membrane fusion protein, adhesin transport system